MFFYTRINNPILLAAANARNLAYVQREGNLATKGILAIPDKPNLTPFIR